MTNNLSEKHSYKKITPEEENKVYKYKAGNNAPCFIKDNVFKVTYYDQIIKDIGDILKLTLNRRFLRTGEIKQLVADTKRKPKIDYISKKRINLRIPAITRDTEVFLSFHC